MTTAHDRMIAKSRKVRRTSTLLAGWLRAWARAVEAGDDAAAAVAKRHVTALEGALWRATREQANAAQWAEAERREFTT